jgi:TRAP-type transport system periplasmic protein
MKGVADGAVTTVESLEGFRLGEVIHHVTQNYGSAGCASEFVVMNKQKWNAFPADIKAIIDKMSEEYAEKQARLWDEIDATGAEFFTQKGGKFVPLSKEEDARWAAAMKPIFDEYVKEMKTKGLPGEEALKFCQEYLKRNQK